MNALLATLSVLATTPMTELAGLLTTPQALRVRIRRNLPSDENVNPDSAMSAELTTTEAANEEAAGLTWGQMSEVQRTALLDAAEKEGADRIDLQQTLQSVQPI